jgi:Protein of unknown function (DUF3800)
MLQSFIDASGKGSPQRLVLAGYIAPVEVWEPFSIAWKTRLDEAGLPYFKMTEQRSKPEIAGYFYRLVEDYDVRAAISCIVNTADLTKVCQSIKGPPGMVNMEAFTNPYYFAFKAIIKVLAQYQTKLGLTEPVDFIFDTENESINTLKYYHFVRESSSPEYARLMGHLPHYQKDEETMPLQAADLYAWWVRKWENDGVSDWAKTLPFPWGIKKDIPRLVMTFKERDFRIEYSRALAKAARNQEEFLFALSILPPDWREGEEQSS